MNVIKWIKTAAGAALLIVDVQQRLVPAIHDGPTMVARTVRLAEAAQLLSVPVCATEQYPDGLGPTVGELAAYPGLVMSKTSFDATADPGFATLLPPGTLPKTSAPCDAEAGNTMRASPVTGAGADADTGVGAGRAPAVSLGCAPAAQAASDVAAASRTSRLNERIPAAVPRHRRPVACRPRPALR